MWVGMGNLPGRCRLVHVVDVLGSGLGWRYGQGRRLVIRLAVARWCPLRSSPTYWACTSTPQSDGSDTPDVIGPTTSPPEPPNRTRRPGKPGNSAGPEDRLSYQYERTVCTPTFSEALQDAEPRRTVVVLRTAIRRGKGVGRRVAGSRRRDRWSWR